MSPDDVAGRLRALLDVDARVVQGSAEAVVEREGWARAVAAVHADDVLDTRFFDVLLGTDLGDGVLEVLVRLWSVAGRHAVLLRTTCPVDDPRVPSLVPVLAGAAWHERETAEMLGVVFEGHPGLEPLLLDAGAGHPLRKDVLLAARQEQPWPGAVEPGESAPNPRRVPPGVRR